jgi:hypothetical protein
VITHGLPARLPPKQLIQAKLVVYGTIAVEASKREVGRVLQGVKRRVRSRRAGYAAGSCEEVALIVGGGEIWSGKSFKLWE